MVGDTLKDEKGQSSFGRFSGLIIVLWALSAVSFAMWKDAKEPYIERDLNGAVVKTASPTFDWDGYGKLFESATIFASAMYGISKGFDAVGKFGNKTNGNATS